jgi:tRNA/rRNA methyltransferase
MTARVNLDNILVVLHRPRYPENIGSAARAMWNMGLRHLVVVSPENFNLVQVLKLATHEAAHIVKQAQHCHHLQEALSGCHYVVGTTARLGKQRQVIQKPEHLANHLIPISQRNRIAVLFGPEDSGLANEDIRNCHALLNIPTAGFSSINLAQAVMIVSYALYTAGLENTAAHVPRLASRHELDGMYEQLKDILVRISYVNPENPDYFMNNLRRFFTRMQLRAKEVTIIRGLCRQVDWYAGKRYQDGLRDATRQEP